MFAFQREYGFIYLIFYYLQLNKELTFQQNASFVIL